MNSEPRDDLQPSAADRWRCSAVGGGFWHVRSTSQGCVSAVLANRLEETPTL